MKSFKIFIYSLLFFVAQSTCAQVTGNLQITNNGVAPVPIFALGSPAILSTSTIRKGKFYFNPEFNLGLDGKPWTIFSRLGYYLIENKKLTIGLATNLNWFFMKRLPMINDEEFQVQRYASFELNGQFRPIKNQIFYFSYWRSDRLDKVGVLYEDFVNFAYGFDNIKLGNKNCISIRPSAFYLKDYKWVSGFFAAQTTNYQRENWKCNLFVTTAWPMSDMPGTSFTWNTGVNIPF